MVTCAAFGCTNRSSRKLPGTHFHKFPRDENLRRMWIMAVRRKDWSPTALSTLCSKHFTEDMIDRSSLLHVRLKENAIPTIFDYPSNEKQVSEVLKESSATNPKTVKTIAAPLSVKQMKNSAIPSELPTTSFSSVIPLQEKQRLEAERIARALRESLENSSEDFFHLPFNYGATSNSSDIRLSENKRKTEVQSKSVKRQKLDDIPSDNPVNNYPSINPSVKQQSYSNGIQSIAGNINLNDTEWSPTVMPQVQIKEEEPWESGYAISSNSLKNSITDNTSKNNSLRNSTTDNASKNNSLENSTTDIASKNNSLGNSTTDNVQIESVVSLSSESNCNIIDKGNPTKKLQEQLDCTFYTKPLGIDERDKSFGNFVSCEISDLQGNPKLYMKTKQKIIRILAEAHFEQMSLDKNSLSANPVLRTSL